MKVHAIIEAMGGRACVARLWGVGSAQISHCYTRDYIPAHHIRLCIALRPELDWNDLLHSDTSLYIHVLLDSGVQNVRAVRLKPRAASV